MTKITIVYDCGRSYTIPSTLGQDNLAIKNAALIDTLSLMADAQHAQEHKGKDCVL